MSWTLIEHQALTSSVASVTLGNGGTLPQTYKSLKLVISARENSTNNWVGEIQLNAASTNRTARRLTGDGAAASSQNETTFYFGYSASNTTANTFGNVEITIPNYSGSTNKPISIDSVTETNATTAYAFISAGLWSSTAAITSIVVKGLGTDQIATNSTFTLYGLK